MAHARQGYYPQMQGYGQGYQPMGPTPNYNYRAPAPAGVPHPDVYSYYNSSR